LRGRRPGSVEDDGIVGAEIAIGVVEGFPVRWGKVVLRLSREGRPALKSENGLTECPGGGAERVASREEDGCPVRGGAGHTPNATSEHARREALGFARTGR